MLSLFLYFSLSHTLSHTHTHTHTQLTFRFISPSSKCRNLTTRCIYEVRSLTSPRCRQLCVWRTTMPLSLPSLSPLAYSLNPLHPPLLLSPLPILPSFSTLSCSYLSGLPLSNVILLFSLIISSSFTQGHLQILSLPLLIFFISFAPGVVNPILIFCFSSKFTWTINLVVSEVDKFSVFPSPFPPSLTIFNPKDLIHSNEEKILFQSERNIWFQKRLFSGNLFKPSLLIICCLLSAF